MSAFKPGDKVYCWGGDMDRILRTGQVYTVTGLHPRDHDMLILEGVEGKWFAGRFEPVEEDE